MRSVVEAGVEDAVKVDRGGVGGVARDMYKMIDEDDGDGNDSDTRRGTMRCCVGCCCL